MQNKNRNNNIWFISIISLTTIICWALIVLYLYYEKQSFLIDYIVLILLFAGIGILFIPFISRLKIGGFFELQRFEDEVSEIRSVVLKDEVVIDEYGHRFYIDKEGYRYIIPDELTARFLRSSKGEIRVKADDIEPYILNGEIESVDGCKILHWGGHVFAILNDRKYHVNTASFLAEWNRPISDYIEVNDNEISKYPTGR